MIILVSDDPVQTEPLCIQLKQKGYLYSLVHDETKALEAVRSAGTSLLLIDTTCTSFDGFGLCRTVKTDESLQGLPVLLLTSLADSSVLLWVLDSRADGFIAKPYDPQTLLSAIDDLRKGPGGERPSPAVRTRFVVSQDGRDYSVVADRRQLLEFLLSAFELAVRTRREQDLTKNEIGGRVKGLMNRLSAITTERDTTIRNLHDELEGRTSTITTLTATLQEKERQESALHTQSDTLVQDQKEKSARIAALEGQVDEQNARIERLSSDLATARTALAQEQIQRAGLEKQSASSDEWLKQEREKNKKMSEDLASAAASLDAEKKKREELEGRIRAAMDEIDARQWEWKDRTSQVSRGLSDMEAALIQAQERLADESALNRDLKEQIAALTAEHDHPASSHGAAAGDQSGVQKELQVQKSALEQERQERASVEAELAALQKKYAGAQQFLDSASRDIGVLNAALAEEREKRKNAEERFNAMIKESGTRDQGVGAPIHERPGMDNELDKRVTTPPAGGGQIGEPSLRGATEEPVAQKPDTTPLSGGAQGAGQKGPDPLLPLPTVQMKLPGPEPSGLLPGALVQEHDVPVMEAPKKSPQRTDGGEKGSDTTAETTIPSPPPARLPADLMVNRNLWFDMIKWVHHTDTILPGQQKELLGSLMKTSRLVQQGRHLTSRQEESMRALLGRLQALGYRFH
jgi:DNA-binding response OmpR family regulator